ncbi:MAG TPA: hypothetical protein VE907_03855 [Gammaproteobacteria bacterium]|nr:hypothetical protein [Gammaproteobacteria bacterium]
MNDQGDEAERGERLRAELAGLRERLRGVNAPPFEATGLPAALRARGEWGEAAAPLPVVSHAPAARRWRAPLAAAAAVAVGAIAALLAARHVLPPADSGAGRPAALDARPAAPSTAEPGAYAAFQPLMYAPGFSPSGSYSVVRVRIPLSALAQGPRLEGTIEADLLVGEDGLASGIRFASTDTLFVSAGSH